METYYAFDYRSDNYRQLENDYYQYSNLDIPFCLFSDELKDFLVHNGTLGWIMRSEFAKDRRERLFLFKPCEYTKNPRAVLFEYLGCRVVKLR